MAMTPMHMATGMAIVTIIPNPLISIPIAVLSHFLFDLYPEWYNKDDKLDKKEIAGGVIELLLGVSILIVLFTEANWLLWVGAVSANLIDLWEAIYFLITKKKFWFCHNGYFPVKVKTWQGFGMRALQSSFLDLGFISLIILLIIR
jgi:hypothetical protein